ncbi:MAG TPA: hypothetical protein VJY15_20760 [Candidatus Acidoferrum sp.]|nr:hypothetical protein [Candidatus Acidoferrum sp.]
MSKKSNPNCPVSGCRTTAPHVDDPTVKALMIAFAPPTEMTKWTLVAMTELAQSICRDLENKKVFAFHTRIRQPEELYIRTLYTLFVATDKEIPHILSGAAPNGLSHLYDEVNRVVFEGRGLLRVQQPGQSYGTFAPIDTLHDGAHVSYRSFLTCMGWTLKPENIPSPEKYCQHLKTYCDYLSYMHEMFKSGKRKEDVLAGIKNLHRPRPSTSPAH